MNTTSLPLEPIETASVDELRALQLQRLKATLAHAYANSPVYRAKFDAAGVRPEDCQSLADLAKFPFTTKKDLRDSYPFGMFAVPRDQVARVHASSGTTGKPTVVGYTARDIDHWADLVARSDRERWGARYRRRLKTEARRPKSTGFRKFSVSTPSVAKHLGRNSSGPDHSGAFCMPPIKEPTCQM